MEDHDADDEDDGHVDSSEPRKEDPVAVPDDKEPLDDTEPTPEPCNDEKEQDLPEQCAGEVASDSGLVNMEIGRAHV